MQEYSQMWVEVNFTVSAYDELKMCKSRTQAIDLDEYSKNPTMIMDSNLIISKYEVIHMKSFNGIHLNIFDKSKVYSVDDKFDA